MTTELEEIWFHCNRCGQDTKHYIDHRIKRCRTFDHDEYSVGVGTVWEMLQCKGCEEVSMTRFDWCSEDDPMDGPNPTICFPPRASRPKPDWMKRLWVPIEDASLLEEVYTALYADSRRLAAMGARTLLDQYIQRHVGDQGNFSGGLDALEKEKLISQPQRAAIDAAIDTGNAASHRGHCPTSDALNVVIDIVESLIHQELLAESAKELKATNPPRQRTKPDKEEK